MFGRHPRLPIDLAFGLEITNTKSSSISKYTKALQDRLKTAYDLAVKNTGASEARQKTNYDLRTREATLEVGDRVLGKRVAFDGKHKLADKWEEEVYTVLHQPNTSIPVFTSKENGEGPKRTIYRNLLLPIGVDLTTNTCDITLTSKPHTVSATKTLRIRLNNIILPYTDNHFNLSLQLQPYHGLGSFWKRQTFHLSIATKHIKNLPNIDCTVFPDCHVFGFNKTRVSTIEYPGDFLLYNSTTMDTDTELEVHIRQMVIDGDTPSTCGVTMRYGDEIVFLDICTYKTVPVITRNSQEARLTVSNCDENLYLISAGYRAWLHVEVYKSKLAILLHGHLQKSTRNTDLCSLETATSALTKQEMLLFRLDRSQSLFRERGRAALVKTRTLSTANCYCNMGSRTFEQEVLNPLSLKKCNITTALQIGSTLDSNISKNYEARRWTWPTKSGRFKNTSLTDCQMSLTNGPPRKCFLGLITHLDMFNGACLDNVLKTDSTEGNVGIVQAFTWFCQTEALMNSNQSQPWNITASEITTDICPNFCSLNGICSKGVCHCHAGYISEDCSVDKGTEPDFFRILGGQTCALSTGRCFHPTLIVKSFVLINKKDITIHLIPIIFNKTMTILKLSAGYFPLDLNKNLSLDLSSYKMEDETAYGYRMFLLSSVGWTSNFVDYVIYDDRCRNCSSSQLADGTVCTMKKNSCDIGNHCYSNGKVNPSNTRLKCNPDKSQLHWSPV